VIFAFYVYKHRIAKYSSQQNYLELIKTKTGICVSSVAE